MTKPKGVTAQVGDSFLIFAESDEENIGKLGIFRGRAQIFVPYTEMLQIIRKVIENSEICDREAELERKRAMQNHSSFASLLGKKDE